MNDIQIQAMWALIHEIKNTADEAGNSEISSLANAAECILAGLPVE